MYVFMTFSGKLLGKCIPHNQGMTKAAFFYNQPKPNIQPWKHLALCTIVSANCWKSSDFWLLYKLIKLIKSILIYKDFNYRPIFQSIILVGKVTDQTLKSQLLKGQPLKTYGFGRILMPSVILCFTTKQTRQIVIDMTLTFWAAGFAEIPQSTI